MNNELLWDLVQEVRSNGEAAAELNEEKLAVLDMFNLRKEDIQEIVFNPNSLPGPPGSSYWRR